jgi:hypothetical protein
MTPPALPLRAVSITVKIIVLVLTLAFVGQQLGALKDLTYTVGDAGHNVAVVFVFWLSWLPQGFCLSALWVATNVFARLGRGDAFGQAMVKGLRGIGLNLGLSAIAALLVAPSLQPALLGQGWNLIFKCDIESVTIGLIGLMLYLLAWQGKAMKAELESFV